MTSTSAHHRIPASSVARVLPHATLRVSLGSSVLEVKTVEDAP
jgi:hypothetical protein